MHLDIVPILKKNSPCENKSLKKWIAMFCEGLYVILFSLTDKALRKMDFHLPSFL